MYLVFVFWAFALGAPANRAFAQDSKTHETEQVTPQPNQEALAAKQIKENEHLNAAVIKAKMAQAAASRQLTNLLACPKIDPKNKPKLYSPDTQVYYFGRIFQAYRNTQLKIMKDLNTEELTDFKKTFTEESFKKDFIELLRETYKNVTATEELRTTLSTTSDATASALFAIFNDGAHRITDQQTITQIDDGSILTEKPGTTIKRPLNDPEINKTNEKLFSGFFETYKKNFEALYTSSERSKSLSKKGNLLCESLDSGNSHERWEEPKIEERVDTSSLDKNETDNAIKILRNKDIEIFDHGKMQTNKIASSNVENVLIPATKSLDLRHESTANPTKLLAANFDQELESVVSDVRNHNFVFESDDFKKSTDNYYKDFLNKIQNDSSLSTDPEITKILGQSNTSDAIKIENITKFVESKKSNDGFEYNFKDKGRAFNEISKKQTENLRTATEQLIEQRWQQLKNTKLSPQQKYYLSWAAKFLSTPAGKDGLDRAPLYLISAHNEYADTFKRYDIRHLYKAATDSKQLTCITCTQPMRSIDKDGLENPKTTQLILNSGGDEYHDIKYIDGTDIVTSPEILYNLSVALNYLTTNIDQPMPTLKKEPPRYRKSNTP